MFSVILPPVSRTRGTLVPKGTWKRSLYFFSFDLSFASPDAAPPSALVARSPPLAVPAFVMARSARYLSSPTWSLASSCGARRQTWSRLPGLRALLRACTPREKAKLGDRSDIRPFLFYGSVSCWKSLFPQAQSETEQNSSTSPHPCDSIEHHSHFEERWRKPLLQSQSEKL